MRKSLLFPISVSALLLVMSPSPASAWSNGGYSSDPYNPKYGTHDYLFEHALNMLPSAERSAIVHNLSLALYGTEMPDNPDEIGDTRNHHVYYYLSGQLQSDPAADRALAEYNLTLGYLRSEDWTNADKHIGAMSHYITDLAVFGHVMGANTDWGAEDHHSDYESYVQNRTTSYTSSTFDGYIVYDGDMTGMSAYDAAVNLAHSITFGSGNIKSCTWMDANYDWSNTTFKDSCGESMNLAVNYLAEVLHKLYADYSSAPTNNAPILTSGSVSPSSGTSSTTFTYEVTYTDADGDAPSYVKVYIDGISYSMTKISGAYTGGALYRYTKSPLSSGSHTYYFTASDGWATARLPASGSYSGPTVSTEAQNDMGSGGDAGNSFSAAISLTLPATGTGYLDSTDYHDFYGFDISSGQRISIAMTPPSGADFNIYLYNPNQVRVSSSISTGSAAESISYTAPSSGYYYLKISQYSGSGTYSLTISKANNPPSLGSGEVSPSTGTTDNTFIYEVTYTDADNDAPSYVKVYVDGIEHSMSKVGGTYAGGAVYQWSTSALSFGPHTYYFTASDGTDTIRLPASGTYSGPGVVTPTTLSISPSSFSVFFGGTQTLTATLTADENPLANKTITWTATTGNLSSASGTTNSSGQVSVTYTAPSVSISTMVTVSASFAGDNRYGSSGGSSSGTVSPSTTPTTFQVVIIFRKPDGSPLANTKVYYGASEGQETKVLGTTDSEGRVTFTNSALAGKTMYFESSDGKYAGSVYIPRSGGEVPLKLTETTKPVEIPTAAVAGFVILICFIVIMWKFLTSLRKRKG